MNLLTHSLTHTAGGAYSAPIIDLRIWGTALQREGAWSGEKRLREGRERKKMNLQVAPREKMKSRRLCFLLPMSSGCVYGSLIDRAVAPFYSGTALNNLRPHAQLKLTEYCSSSERNMLIIMLAASSWKRNVTVWRPSVCLSIPSFHNINSVCGAYST